MDNKVKRLKQYSPGIQEIAKHPVSLETEVTVHILEFMLAGGNEGDFERPFRRETF